MPTCSLVHSVQGPVVQVLHHDDRARQPDQCRRARAVDPAVDPPAHRHEAPGEPRRRGVVSPGDEVADVR